MHVSPETITSSMMLSVILVRMLKISSNVYWSKILGSDRNPIPAFPSPFPLEFPAFNLDLSAFLEKECPQKTAWSTTGWRHRSTL